MKNKYTHSVLFVDDEIQVLRALRRGVRLEKYNKFFASSGEEALEILDREPIHLVVTDMKMPRINGLDLLREVNKLDPDIVKVILSGYTNISQIITTINKIDIYKFILKPWDIDTEIKPTIQRGLRVYEQNIENRNRNQIIQKDFNSIVKLNKTLSQYSYFLALRLKTGKLSDLNFKKELSYVEDVINNYVRTLPTTREEITLEKLNEDLDIYLQQYFSNDRGDFPELTIKKDFKIDIMGNYIFILLVLKFILENYYDVIPKTKIAIMLKVKPVLDESKRKLIIALKTSAREIESNKLRKNTNNILMNVLMTLVSGKVQFPKKDEENIFAIDMLVDKKEG